jgi:hypothetical protein
MIRIFLSVFLQMWLRMVRLYSVYWSRDVIDDPNTIFTVPRQSFVIHPNDGLWPGNLSPTVLTKVQHTRDIRTTSA